MNDKYIVYIRQLCLQAINLPEKIFYYLDPFGPTRAVRGVFTALRYNFTVHCIKNNFSFDG